MLELYLEDMFQWRSHPDIAPPEAMTPQEARELFDDAAGRHVEVHPMLQVLGHMEKIGAKPAYRHLMLRPSRSDLGWLPPTLDVRKPEAVAFVSDLVSEICEAFPGKFLNVDITEIAYNSFVESGTKAEEMPDLMLAYLLKLREMLASRRMRLMVAQGNLDAKGWLNGIGPILDKLPKDVVISSYYTATFYKDWKKDFSRLAEKGIGFWAMPWIASHDHIMPYTDYALNFSDITVSRGLQYGAMGSVTTDWGDSGHYHLPGLTWYPFVYHCASAWTGAKLDRDYFNRAFCRQVFGVKDDRIARAIILAGNINPRAIKGKTPAAGVSRPIADFEANHWPDSSDHYHQFFANPFSDTRILDVVSPGQKGREVLKPAEQSARLLEAALTAVTRNRDVVEELLFAAKNYQALGKKLIMREHYLDQKTPRNRVSEELYDLAKTYESLRDDFAQLWLAGCKRAGTFEVYKYQYLFNTIRPCRRKAAELRKR
jgi:hypothetical protein